MRRMEGSETRSVSAGCAADGEVFSRRVAAKRGGRGSSALVGSGHDVSAYHGRHLLILGSGTRSGSDELRRWLSMCVSGAAKRIYCTSGGQLLLRHESAQPAEPTVVSTGHRQAEMNEK